MPRKRAVIGSAGPGGRIFNAIVAAVIVLIGLSWIYRGGRLAWMMYQSPVFMESNGRKALIPILFIGFGFVFSVAGIYGFRRYFLRETRLAANRCLKCGYDMRATPRRCPECGTETGLHHEDSA